MSLTRKEWKELWELTHRLELYAVNLPPHVGFKSFLKKYIRHVKSKIRQAIGQME